MFVAHKKTLRLDGSNPCQLYGYGGFNISLSPYFACSRASFMKGVRAPAATGLPSVIPDLPCCDRHNPPTLPALAA